MLFRIITLGLLLNGCSYAAQAQSSAAPAVSPATPDSVPTTFGKWYLPAYQPNPSVADTAGALVSLYSRKRSNTWWWLPVSPLGLSFLQSGTQYVNGIKTKDLPPDSWQYAVGVPLLIGGVTAIVVRLSTYSRTDLAQVVRAYQAGQPIPAKLRRKLRPVYFANAAIMRVTIEQQLQLQQLQEQQRRLRNAGR